MILIDMPMPIRCQDCALHKIFYMDADGYGENCDYCGALKRRFNSDKFDISPFKEKLSDCPLIEIADTPQTMYYPQVDGITPSVIIADTPQTESTGSPIGDYRDGVGAWQTDRMTEEEIDTMLAKALVGQTDCGWK